MSITFSPTASGIRSGTLIVTDNAPPAAGSQAGCASRAQGFWLFKLPDGRLRSLYDGVQAAVIDPEDEYPRLAQAVGGAVVQRRWSGSTLKTGSGAAGWRWPSVACDPEAAFVVKRQGRSVRAG